MATRDPEIGKMPSELRSERGIVIGLKLWMAKGNCSRTSARKSMAVLVLLWSWMRRIRKRVASSMAVN